MRRRVHWPAVLAACAVAPIAIGLTMRAFAPPDLGGLHRAVRAGHTEQEVRRLARRPEQVLDAEGVRRFTEETTPSGTVGWAYYEAHTKSSLIVIFRNGSVVKTVLRRT